MAAIKIDKIFFTLNSPIFHQQVLNLTIKLAKLDPPNIKIVSLP